MHKKFLTLSIIVHAITILVITFDFVKDAKNREKHGVSLADAAEFE
jgi:hypothetical protein